MSNKHSEMADKHLHVAKGFADASRGYSLWKNEKSEQTFEPRAIFPKAISIADSNTNPPTENDGDIYVLNNALGTLTVSSIAWISANTVQYNFSGSPNLSAFQATQYLICRGATNSVHNGAFEITSVNDGSDYIRVTNTLVEDATYDETTGATCSATKNKWDGCSENSWVRYNAAADKWYCVEAYTSALCFITSANDFYYFTGTAWVQFTYANTKAVAKTIYVDSLKGSDTAGQVENPLRPFATIAAAHTASAAYYTGGTAPSSSNIITIVIIGAFSETIQLKSFHNYDIERATLTGGFSDSTVLGGVTCSIYGQGTISNAIAIFLSYASTVYVDVKSIDGAVSVSGSGTLNIRAKAWSYSSSSLITFAAGTINVSDTVMSCTGYSMLVSNATGGAVKFVNCEMTGNQEILKTVTGSNSSTAIFKFCKLKTTGTNYDTINLLTNTGSNLTLELYSCTLVANGTGNSIDAAQATNVKIYGSCETNLTHDTGNVTLQIGTVANGRFLIDTNVT